MVSWTISVIWDYFNIYRRGSPPLFCFGYTITRASGSAFLCLEDTDKLECFWMSEASQVAARISTIGRTMRDQDGIKYCQGAWTASVVVVPGKGFLIVRRQTQEWEDYSFGCYHVRM